MRSTLTRAIVTLIALLVLSPDADAQISAEQASNVRVVSTTGAVREGRLLDLTASEVVLLQDGRTLTLPLKEVQRIERASHGIRRGALAGAIGGFALGMALSCVSSGDDTGCWPPLGGAMLAGIGAGLGMAVGGLHDAARRGSDVIYTAPGQGTTIDLPKVAFAAGGGGVVRGQATGSAVPALQGSVQLPLSRVTSLELDAMHWSWHRARDIVAIADETWHTVTVSGNVSWRIGKPTIGGTIAVGAGVQRSVLTQSRCIRDCHALPYGRRFATHFVETTPHAQIGGSVDKVITPRLIGFGTTRLVLGKERGLAVAGGIRVPVGRRAVTVF